MGTTRTKTLIIITIPETELFVTGSAVGKNVTWLSAVGLTIPQARKYYDAIETVVNFVSVKAGINKPGRGRPAKVVEEDEGETFRKRLLLHSDDTKFVTVRRTPKQYGITSKPVLDIDGFTCDLASARQSASSIGQAIEDALRWR
ncbi:MAG: hypothetical protein HY865_09565 [Chloroflexi bacterium]|nr:hypothetical protein [Chloroflexota bacterium]